MSIRPAAKQGFGGHTATRGRTSRDLFFLVKGCLGNKKIMVVNLRSVHNIFKIMFYGCHRYLGHESQHDWFCIIFGHLLLNIHKLFIHYTCMYWVTACVSAKRSDTTKDLHFVDFLWVGHAPKMSNTSNECSTNTLCFPIKVWSWRKGESSSLPLIKVL